MDLDALAGGDVAEAAAEFLGDGGDLLHLGRGEEAVGDADAEHEVTVVGELLVDAVPAHADEVFFGDGGLAGGVLEIGGDATGLEEGGGFGFVECGGVCPPHFSVAEDVVPDVEAVFGLFDSFDFVDFGTIGGGDGALFGGHVTTPERGLPSGLVCNQPE